MAEISLKGTPVHTCGDLPEVGSSAPDFILVDKSLNNRTLADYQDRKKLLYVVPSLDTSTCAKSTKKFNELTAADGSIILIISADLPFAQTRFCSVEKLENVVPLSMMRNRDFGRDYGIEIIDGPLAGITARAIIVIDEADRVVYTELVSDIADEPDYEKSNAAVSHGPGRPGYHPGTDPARARQPGAGAGAVPLDDRPPRQ